MEILQELLWRQGQQLAEQYWEEKDLLIQKKSTRSSITGLKSSFAAAPSKSYLNKNNEPSKLAKYGGMPTRIATMPIGMIKDLTTGGIVGMTKNIIPRAKNIVKGDSIVNHAQGKSILLKEQENANNTEEHKG